MKIAFIQNRLLSRKISFEKERSIAYTEFYINSSNLKQHQNNANCAKHGIRFCW